MTARWHVPLFAAAVTVSACSQTFGPTKVDDNWHMTESTYFTLHARPATFADQSAATLGGVLDDQYEVTQRLLGATYGSRINGFLYNDASDGNFESEHSGVAFTDTAAFRATATP